MILLEQRVLNDSSERCEQAGTAIKAILLEIIGDLVACDDGVHMLNIQQGI